MPKVAHILILAVCAAVVAAALLLDADDTGVYLFGWELPIKCTMHEMTGIRCASCGMTRAVCLAARGEIAEAFRMNAVWPAVFAVVLLEIPYRVAALVRWPRKFPRGVVVAHAAIVLAAAACIIGNWILYLGGLLR
ncbi:MAG TPA: DUF2752 domain-containing protein [Sedimentisphaerales bacterium]|nr:DUF2752 domain-containing protein [Sedimentisphaerales bacterium]